MNFINKLRKLFKDSFRNQYEDQTAIQRRNYESQLRAMTDEEKEYERDKIHQLINSHPISAKQTKKMERDISAY